MKIEDATLPRIKDVSQRLQTQRNERPLINNNDTLTTCYTMQPMIHDMKKEYFRHFMQKQKFQTNRQDCKMMQVVNVSLFFYKCQLQINISRSTRTKLALKN